MHADWQCRPETCGGIDYDPCDLARGARPMRLREPNPEQPDRCPSIDPLGTLQCDRRIHDDDRCQLGGIAWKKTV